MKKILTILLLGTLLATPVGMRAADKKNALIVLTKDMVQHQFLLTDKPTAEILEVLALWFAPC